MGRWRRVVLWTAVVGLVVSLSACGSTSGQSSAGGAAAAPPDFPVTVQNCGRTLTFDAPPKRVVTGYEPVLETMLALRLQDRIVGRTNWSENGPDAFLPGQKALYDRIPEISDSILFPNREAMLAQDADFVISEGWYNFDASQGQATIDELASAGTKVFITGGWCSDAEQRKFRITDTLQDVRNLGRIFGVTDRAEKLVAEMQGILDEVTKAVAGRPRVPVLATNGGKGPVKAYGGAGLTDQLIEAAGGTNVLAGIEDDYVDVSVEQVAATNPSAMLVTDYRPGPTGQEKFATVAALVPDSPAARTKRWLRLFAVGQHPGYRNIVTLRQIARFLHPEAFR
jgi:iron complex transport system substrate-binding protein